MASEYVPVYFDWLEVTQDLTAEEKGNLIDAVVAYASGQEFEHLLNGGSMIAFRFLKGQVDRNNAISDIRRNARANKKEQNGTNENKTEETGTNDNKVEETETKSPKEINKEKEKEKETEKERETKKRFSPPTLEEVAAYCEERKNGINALHFIDYYQARGWELKPGQKMKDWQACVRTWEQRRSTGAVAASGGQKGIIAHQYEQRAYTGTQRDADDILDSLENMGGAKAG